MKDALLSSLTLLDRLAREEQQMKFLGLHGHAAGIRTAITILLREVAEARDAAPLRCGDDRVSWSFWLILIPTGCYSLAAGVYAFQKNWPMVIVYSGYAWANTGLLWLDRLAAKG